jgi:hypothetical protein
MEKRHVCRGCVKGCKFGETHNCQPACRDCMYVPPCSFSGTRILCGECNKTFRSRACFARHKANTLLGEAICGRKTMCAQSGNGVSPRTKHECLKRFCEYCKKHRETCQLCYMLLLANKLPRSENMLFVFYDFETMQDTRLTDSATLHVPNLVCLQQFCSRCENEADIDAH